MENTTNLFFSKMEEEDKDGKEWKLVDGLTEEKFARETELKYGLTEEKFRARECLLWMGTLGKAGRKTSKFEDWGKNKVRLGASLRLVFLYL